LLLSALKSLSSFISITYPRVRAQAGVGSGHGIPNVPIIETCMEHRIHESIPFSDFLGQHLPFKIPVHSQEVVSQYICIPISLYSALQNTLRLSMYGWNIKFYQ